MYCFFQKKRSEIGDLGRFFGRNAIFVKLDKRLQSPLVAFQLRRTVGLLEAFQLRRMVGLSEAFRLRRTVGLS